MTTPSSFNTGGGVPNPDSPARNIPYTLSWQKFELAGGDTVWSYNFKLVNPEDYADVCIIFQNRQQYSTAIGNLERDLQFVLGTEQSRADYIPSPPIQMLCNLRKSVICLPERNIWSPTKCQNSVFGRKILDPIFNSALDLLQILIPAPSRWLPQKLLTPMVSWLLIMSVLPM